MHDSILLRSQEQIDRITHLSAFDLSAILVFESGMTRVVRAVDGVQCRSRLSSAMHYLNCASKALETFPANLWSFLIVTSQGGQM
jgi:hypothetical protein